MGHLRNSVCQTGLIGLLVLALIYPSMCYAKDELRTWTDKSGRNKIKAKFVKLEEDVVTLEKDDGEEIEIELKKLSTADAKFATQAAKESEDNPFKSKSEDPFKSKSKSKSKNSKPEKGDRRNSKEDRSDDEMREIDVDLKDAENINLSSSGGAWSVDIPKSESTTVPGKLKSISLARTTNFFEKVAGFEIGQGQSSKIAVVGYLHDRDKGSETTRISMCDLSTGKSSDPVSTNAVMAPIALHDDGKQILMRSEVFGYGNKERLEVWTVKGSKIVKSLGWVPYHTEKGAARDVTWAKFISKEKLATCSGNGKIVFWKYPEIEPILQIETGDGAYPALTADRKYLAYCTSEFIGLFDIEKQDVLAQQSTPSRLIWPALAFSRSGSLLACLSHATIYVWDVATGELRLQFRCNGIQGRHQIEFLNDQFVMLEGRYVIDIENQVQVWIYEGGEQTRTVDGITYFAVSNGHTAHGAILPLQLPHQPAIDTLNKSIDDPDFFIVKKGTTVRIDVSGVPDGSRREQVIKGLTERLAEFGCNAGADGTIDLVATVTGPKETKLSFFHEGTFAFKEYATEVKYVYKGKEVWTSRGTNTPMGGISLKPGEGMSAHLQALEKPDYTFFNTVYLPKLVQRPGPEVGLTAKYALGFSRVTSKGLQ